MVIFWYSIGFHSYVSSPEVIHHGIHIYIHIMGWLGWFPLLTFANYMIYALVTNIHILHIIYWLVVWNINYIFPLILGISSSQLTHIFQRGGPGPPTSFPCSRSRCRGVHVLLLAGHAARLRSLGLSGASGRSRCYAPHRTWFSAGESDEIWWNLGDTARLYPVGSGFLCWTFWFHMDIHGLNHPKLVKRWECQLKKKGSHHQRWWTTEIEPLNIWI